MPCSGGTCSRRDLVWAAPARADQRAELVPARVGPHAPWARRHPSRRGCSTSAAGGVPARPPTSARCSRRSSPSASSSCSRKRCPSPSRSEPSPRPGCSSARTARTSSTGSSRGSSRSLEFFQPAHVNWGVYTMLCAAGHDHWNILCEPVRHLGPRKFADMDVPVELVLESVARILERQAQWRSEPA